MPVFIQPSFARGELTPALFGRVDTNIYGIGLRTAKNVVIEAGGGASNRPGLEFDGACKIHTQDPSLIPFQYSTTDQYLLEFGDLYMRVMRNGAHVLEADKTITGATQANPVVVTSTAHGFSNGDEVFISAVAGMTQLNGRRFKIANAAANTFELQHQVTSANIDGTAYTAYTSGGTAARVYTLTTPYASADLPILKYSQDANTLTLTHNGYAPRKLTRTDHAAWTLVIPAFTPQIASPTSVTVTPNTGGGVTWNYKVTAVVTNPFEESLPTTGTTAAGAVAPDNTVSWPAVTGAERYTVYRQTNGLYIFIGETETTSFKDANIQGDASLSPPSARNPFSAAGDFPAASGFFEQRQIYGGASNSPDTTFYSQTGNYDNFTTSYPLNDADAITATLVSGEVNQIRHFIPGADLLVFTSGAEWRVSSGADAAFTPSSIRQKPQSFWGCAHHKPIVSGDNVIFVGENNSSIRSFSYSLEKDKYKGGDLTVSSSHLFDGREIKDTAWSSFPAPRMFIVLDNGVMLVLTYNEEQQMVAWTRWETDGEFKRVAVLRAATSSTEDGIYVVVQRTIGGNTVRYIEEVHSRVFDTVKDCFFVDSGLSLDDPRSISGISLANPIVITSTAHGFSNGDEIDLSDIVWEPNIDAHQNSTQPDQLNGRRFKAANVAANTFELNTVAGNAVDGTGYNAYVKKGNAREAVLTLGGLHNLAGETIVGLMDGAVVTGLAVSSTGQVTLPRKASRVHLGLRYVSDIETLDIEAPQGTIQGARKQISSVTFRFYKSVGFLHGPDENRLHQAKQREFEKMGAPVDLLTGDKKVYLEPAWNTNGRFLLRQMNPLPLTLLAAIPKVDIGT